MITFPSYGVIIEYSQLIYIYIYIALTSYRSAGPAYSVILTSYCSAGPTSSVAQTSYPLRCLKNGTVIEELCSARQSASIIINTLYMPKQLFLAPYAREARNF